jgi:hypothetical protein
VRAPCASSLRSRGRRGWIGTKSSITRWVFGEGLADPVEGPGAEPMRAGFSRDYLEAMITQRGWLSLNEFVLCRVRYFTGGAAISSKDWIEGVLKENWAWRYRNVLILALNTRGILLSEQTAVESMQRKRLCLAVVFTLGLCIYMALRRKHEHLGDSVQLRYLETRLTTNGQNIFCEVLFAVTNFTDHSMRVRLAAVEAKEAQGWVQERAGRFLNKEFDWQPIGSSGQTLLDPHTAAFGRVSAVMPANSSLDMQYFPQRVAKWRLKVDSDFEVTGLAKVAMLIRRGLFFGFKWNNFTGTNRFVLFGDSISVYSEEIETRGVKILAGLYVPATTEVKAFANSFAVASPAGKHDLVIRAILGGLIKQGLTFADARMMFGQDLQSVFQPETRNRQVIFQVLFNPVQPKARLMKSEWGRKWSLVLCFSNNGNLVYYSLVNRR